jgi:hypothetical protein
MIFSYLASKIIDVSTQLLKINLLTALLSIFFSLNITGVSKMNTFKSGILTLYNG